MVSSVFDFFTKLIFYYSIRIKFRVYKKKDKNKNLKNLVRR